MDKINNLFDQEITKTVDAYPSIFSKDDVCNLLTALRTNVLMEVSELKPTASITEMQFQAFRECVTNELERSLCNGNIEVYDPSSAEFSIDYNNTLILENMDVNTDNITDELDNILLDQFQQHFNNLITDKSE
jgi:hypothetical protein